MLLCRALHNVAFLYVLYLRRFHAVWAVRWGLVQHKREVEISLPLSHSLSSLSAFWHKLLLSPAANPLEISTRPYKPKLQACLSVGRDWFALFFNPMIVA